MKNRILIVDYDQSMCEMIEAYMRRRNFLPVWYTSAEEAFASLTKEDFDIVLSDLNMPGMGGDMLYEKILTHKPALQNKIIFTTGDSVSKDNKAFLLKSGRPFLPKPFNIIDVKKMVDKMLREKPIR